ncbi:MAG: SLC13 family permease [Pseudomonadota bacterium]
MLGGFLPAGTAPILALAIVAVMFVLFVREVYPTEVVAIGGVAVLLLGGVLPYDRAIAVFSNPAPWTIGAMFILSGALVRTGTLSSLTNWITTVGATRPKTVLAAVAVFTVFASAFMNNTPVVVVLIPVAAQIARMLGVKASKLLIPLSYMAIFGGMLTLIGTSTNLLVDGVARDQGLAPFTLFEITPLTLILAAFGAVYLTLLAPRMLPNRDTLAQMGRDKSTMKFITEVVIPEGSTLIDQSPFEIEAFKRDGGRVIDVLRGDDTLRFKFPDVRLIEGDRVVLRTRITEVLGLQDNKEVLLADKVSSRESTTVEALIAPGCRLVGRKLSELNLRRRFGVYPLAVHRRNQNLGREIGEIRVQVGDTILLEGAPKDIQRLAREMELVDLAEPEVRSYRRSFAPLVMLTLAAVVTLAAMGVAPIFALAVVAVAVVLLTRAIDADEAFASVDGRLLVLIFAMLGIGAALEESGAVALIAEAVAPQIAGLPPFFVVWAIYLLTSVLTELVSNNAVAVVVTPIAVALAIELGLDPRPLVIAVMVAASASFATPIGYQTNTLVYGPGGYRFTDFMKIGIPLNLCIGLLASLLIPLIWEL